MWIFTWHLHSFGREAQDFSCGDPKKSNITQSRDGEGCSCVCVRMCDRAWLRPTVQTIQKLPIARWNLTKRMLAKYYKDKQLELTMSGAFTQNITLLQPTHRLASHGSFQSSNLPPWPAGCGPWVRTSCVLSYTIFIRALKTLRQLADLPGQRRVPELSSWAELHGADHSNPSCAKLFSLRLATESNPSFTGWPPKDVLSRSKIKNWYLPLHASQNYFEE